MLRNGCCRRREKERKEECSVKDKPRKIDIDFGAGQGISRCTLRKFHSFFVEKKLMIQERLNSAKETAKERERETNTRNTKQANIFFFRLCKKTKRKRSGKKKAT